MALSMVEQAAKPLARPVRVSSLFTRCDKGVEPLFFLKRKNNLWNFMELRKSLSQENFGLDFNSRVIETLI